MIGHIDGVRIGQSFESRRELYDQGVHGALRHGISHDGNAIVLSGGYVDDEDHGDIIIYTGEGGRNKRSKRQIKDQLLERGNLALVKNFNSGAPIRVIRGSELKSKYSPSLGYRYDGLYRIDDAWSETGRDGYLIYRFRLVRLEDQISINDLIHGSIEPTETQRQSYHISRVIRDSRVGNLVKRIYRYRCQICGVRLRTPTGFYAECCHIQPLGEPHNGPDVLENVLCLCPNHHVMFDKHALYITDDFEVFEIGKKLETKLILEHYIDFEYIKYHRQKSLNI